jgi:hypothetical protein
VLETPKAGDTVYKQVAMPLLLEMLKKDMGFNFPFSSFP